MGSLISAFTVIRALSIFHITVAYFFLVAPQNVVSQNLVAVLGAAMRVPMVEDFSKPTEVTAFLALVIAFLGVSDLVAVSLPDITALEYWITQVPIRLFLLFGITSYTYLFKNDGIFGSGRSIVGTALRTDRSTGELLCNNLVFSAGFIEASFWFWVFVLLKDERSKLAAKLAQRQHERQELYGQQ